MPRLLSVYAISKMTFPASPDLIARIASSASSSGKRCVMTGVGSNWPERKEARHQQPRVVHPPADDAVDR